MKDITAKDNYDGVTDPVPATEAHSAEEFNDRRSELQNAVTTTGLILNAADAHQLTKGLFANGVAAQSMVDSGGVNTIVLTPVSGASGLRVPVPATPDYSALDGAIFNFQSANTNNGNVTVNVGQTGGTLIGAQPLFLEDGSTEVPVGNIIASRYYNVRYDSSLDADGAFVLMQLSLPSGLTGANESIGETSIGEFHVKWGYVTTGSAGVATVHTFAGLGLSDFPNANFRTIPVVGELTAGFSKDIEIYDNVAAGFTSQISDQGTLLLGFISIGR